MMVSNTPKAFSVSLTDSELEHVKQVNGPNARYVAKQLSPVEFALVLDDVGAVFTPYEGRDNHNWILRTVRRPAVLKTKFWGMGIVKDGGVVKGKIKFVPDTTKTHIERNVGPRQQIKPDLEAVSLPEFRMAVDTVNRFVTENEGHVALDIKTGLLKFLVEG